MSGTTTIQPPQAEGESKEPDGLVCAVSQGITAALLHTLEFDKESGVVCKPVDMKILFVPIQNLVGWKYSINKRSTSQVDISIIPSEEFTSQTGQTTLDYTVNLEDGSWILKENFDRNSPIGGNAKNLGELANILIKSGFFDQL